MILENLGWSLEASSYFEELAQGQILQAQIVAYSEDGVPFVHLYRIQGVTVRYTTLIFFFPSLTTISVQNLNPVVRHCNIVHINDGISR